MARDEGALAAAFLAGVVVGAVAGILLAPRPGRESREQLGDMVSGAKQEAGEGLEDWLARVAEAVRAASEAFRPGTAEAAGSEPPEAPAP